MLEPCHDHDPETVGSFHILRRLGEGGFGTVFAAHDHSRPDELAAVKVFKPGTHDVETFSREIEAIKRVDSPYVPAFVDGGISAGASRGKEAPWLAIELVQGLSLFDVVNACGALAEPAVWQIGKGIAAALEAIKRAGAVHRDLKPGNVLITQDGPRIIDFGLVHLTGLPLSQQWSHGWLAGTIEYMPPEVLAGSLHDGTVAGDIFMLGGTLIYAATQHPPFAAPSARMLRPRPPEEQPDLSGLSAGLAPVVTRCLSYRQADRPSLGTLAEQFAKRTYEAGPFADALPADVHRQLDLFRQDLAAALDSCAGAPGPDVAVDSPRRWRDRRGDHQDRQRGSWTAPYTRQDRAPGEYVRTVPEETQGPGARVIRPVLPDQDGPWDTRDESWRWVRWACQFGAWIQAPVTVVDGVAVAADLDGTIGGLDARDGSQLWAFTLGAAVRSAAVPLHRTLEVCVGDAGGVVHAVEFRSGRRRELFRAEDAVHGPLAVDGNRVYAVSGDGRLYAIDAETAVSRVLLGAHDLAPCAPATQAGVVFAATTQGEVLAIDSASGGVRWRVPTGGRICAAPLPVRDRLYIGGTDGRLLEVDPLGRVRAAADLGSAVHVPLVHDGYRLYAGSCDGTVRAFSLDRRRVPALAPLWESPLRGEVTGLTAGGGQLYAAAGDSVLKLDPATGASALVFRMECPVAAAAAASAGRLYVAGLGGTVCCVSPG